VDESVRLRIAESVKRKHAEGRYAHLKGEKRQEVSNKLKRAWAEGKFEGRTDFREKVRQAWRSGKYDSLKGAKRDEVVCKKISESLKGKTLSAEHRLSISLANKARAEFPTDAMMEGREKIRRKLTGFIHSEKSRRNISEGLKNFYSCHAVSQESRKKMSLAHRGEVHSDEYKRKMSKIKAEEIIAGVGRKSHLSFRGVSFRSKGELRVAKWLDAQNIGWIYEPEAFLLANGRHYVPDFRLADGRYLEVKTPYTLRDSTKIQLFRMLYKLDVINSVSMKYMEVQ
jgi:hypothetical protein